MKNIRNQMVLKEHMWLACAIAWREIGGYQRRDEKIEDLVACREKIQFKINHNMPVDLKDTTPTFITKESNASVALRYLNNLDLMEQVATIDDRNLAENVIKHIEAFVLRGLSRSLNNFELEALGLVQSAEIAIKRVYFATYMFTDYFRQLGFEKQKATVDECRDSFHVGVVGERWSGKVTVLSSYFNKKYQHPYYYNIAKDEKGCLVQFSTGANKPIQVGAELDISGRVKGHVQTQDRNLPMTRLNYVKIIQADEV